MSQAFVEFLTQELSSRRERNPQYSLRAFALSLQISPAQLSQILSNKRRLTLKMMHKMTQRLVLSPAEKQKYLGAWAEERMQLGSVQEKTKRQMRDDEFKLISEWHHFAILSLASLKNATIDPWWISSKLDVPASQAREAVIRLQRLGILGPGPALKQISPPLSVVSEVPSMAIRGYHQKILQMAQEKLEEVPLEKRDYSALTLPIKVKNLKKYRQLIEKFQDDLLDLASAKPGEEEEVYVFSCQLFPIQKERNQS